MLPDLWSTVSDSFQLLYKKRSTLFFVILGALASSLAYFSDQPFLAAIKELPQNPSPGILLPVVIPFLPALLSGTLLVALFDVFIVAAVMSSAAAKQDDANDSAGKAARRYLPLLGVSISNFLIIAVLALLLFSVAFLVILSSALVGLVLLLVFFIPILYVYFRLRLSKAECVLGGRGVIASLKTSWSETKGNLWYIFGVAVLVGIIASIVGGLAEFVFTLASVAIIGIFISYAVSYADTIWQILVYQALHPSPLLNVKGKKVRKKKR